jgi:hypothetical protein
MQWNQTEANQTSSILRDKYACKDNKVHNIDNIHLAHKVEHKHNIK